MRKVCPSGLNVTISNMGMGSPRHSVDTTSNAKYHSALGNYLPIPQGGLGNLAMDGRKRRQAWARVQDSQTKTQAASNFASPSRQDLDSQRAICLQALKEPSATLDRVGSMNLSKAKKGKGSVEMPQIFAKQRHYLDKPAKTRRLGQPTLQ